MKVDRNIVSRAAQAPGEREVESQAGGTGGPRRYDHFVEVPVARDDRRRLGLDHVRQVTVGEPTPNRTNGGRGEDDVANHAEPEQENLHA